MYLHKHPHSNSLIVWDIRYFSLLKSETLYSLNFGTNLPNLKLFSKLKNQIYYLEYGKEYLSIVTKNFHIYSLYVKIV